MWALSLCASSVTERWMRRFVGRRGGVYSCRGRREGEVLREEVGERLAVRVGLGASYVTPGYSYCNRDCGR